MGAKRPARQERAATVAARDDIAYPSTRYFQIHFQYLHELLGLLQEQLQETNRKLAELRQNQQDEPNIHLIQPNAQLAEDVAKPKRHP